MPTKIQPKFLTEFIASKKSDARNWRVHEPLLYQSEVLRKNGIDHLVTVPASFDTDLASVPRPFWNIIPPDGTYTPAAVVHDWLYRRTTIHRAICDLVFLEAMKVCKTGFLARQIIYWNVRAFGWLARKEK